MSSALNPTSGRSQVTPVADWRQCKRMITSFIIRYLGLASQQDMLGHLSAMGTVRSSGLPPRNARPVAFLDPGAFIRTYEIGPPTPAALIRYSRRLGTLTRFFGLTEFEFDRYHTTRRDGDNARFAHPSGIDDLFGKVYFCDAPQ